MLIPAGIIKTSANEEYYLQGQAGYANALTELEKISKLYGRGTYASGARCITVDDVNKVTGYDPSNPANGAVSKYGSGELNEYGNVVKYYWDGTEKPHYIGSNGKNGNLGNTQNRFHWYDFPGSEWKSSAYTSDASLSNLKEITTLTSDYYSYYPKTLTTSSSGITYGISKDSPEYDVLLGNTNSLKYWLGSRYVKTGWVNAEFGIRYVFVDRVSGSRLYNSYSYTNLVDSGVRPLVSLQSDISLEPAGSNSWTLS